MSGHKILLIPPPPLKVAIIGNCAPGIKVNYAGIIFEGLGYIFSKIILGIFFIYHKKDYFVVYNYGSSN